MSQYLNGLSYVMTQLCGSYTSFPITLALQHCTCILQFSNILCHKISQYYTLWMLQILFKNILIKFSITSSDVGLHLYLSIQLIMVSQHMSLNHSLCITHKINSSNIFIIIINITCIGLYMGIHVMHCIYITNAVNMLVMCNKEIYCPCANSLFRLIPSILTLHYYLKRSFFTINILRALTIYNYFGYTFFCICI